MTDSIRKFMDQSMKADRKNTTLRQDLVSLLEWSNNVTDHVLGASLPDKEDFATMMATSTLAITAILAKASPDPTTLDRAAYTDRLLDRLEKAMDSCCSCEDYPQVVRLAHEAIALLSVPTTPAQAKEAS